MLRARDGLGGLLAVVAALLLAPSASLATPGGQLSAKTFPGSSPGFAGGQAVAVSPDGTRTFTAGSGEDVSSTSDDILIVAFSQRGGRVGDMLTLAYGTS